MQNLAELADSRWADLSIEDRGLLFTFLATSRGEEADRLDLTDMATLAARLAVTSERCRAFLDAATAAGIYHQLAGDGTPAGEQKITLSEWERRFDEDFWPAVTAPWKKMGRANALRVWSTKTWKLVKPQTAAAADALCEQILRGVDRYKLLLSQPNAPQMKYPEGWISGERWKDEIDAQLLQTVSGANRQPEKLTPLERARREQSRLTQHARVIDIPAALPSSLPAAHVEDLDGFAAPVI